MVHCVAVFLLLAETPAAPPARAVAWSEIRADLGATICVLKHELPDGRTAHSYMAGSREACSKQGPASSLSRAVDAALEKAQVLHAATGPGEIGFSFDAARSPEENNRKMREAYLASESFLEPVLRRLPAALAVEGLTCADCPAPAAAPLRTTTWAAFLPYLTAHVWPDAVRTPLDDRGEPAGDPQYGFHVCAGLNGIAEIEDADPDLVRAGFVAAMATQELRQIAMEHFQGLLGEPDFAGLADDDARTAYLRRYLGARLASDDRLAPPVCDTLRLYAADLGLVVDGCAPAEEVERGRGVVE